MKYLHLVLAALLAANPALAGQMNGHAAARQAGSAMHDAVPVSEPGQSAFAAIAEIVAALDANPKTDWSRVDISVLQAHLADMERVFTEARVRRETVDGGARFIVTGTPEVAASIRAMVVAHAKTMQGVAGWRYDAIKIPEGAILVVTAPSADRAKLLGLGFFGIMAEGTHHQRHHWMLANGLAPH